MKYSLGKIGADAAIAGWFGYLTHHYALLPGPLAFMTGVITWMILMRLGMIHHDVTKTALK